MKINGDVLKAAIDASNNGGPAVFDTIKTFKDRNRVKQVTSEYYIEDGGEKLLISFAGRDVPDLVEAATVAKDEASI